MAQRDAILIETVLNATVTLIKNREREISARS
jgi:hypothetical protein